mgnify:CR=1 FL=1
MLSNAILTLFKDSLTLIGLLFVMFFQNWKLALISIIMIPLASIAAKTLGKRISKVTTEAQQKSGFLTTYLVELFKNHKLIKIFQKESFEKNRADEYLTQLKEKNQKIQTVYVRMSPIMETLTGIMIAILIFYSGKLIMNGQLNINNFFSFLPFYHDISRLVRKCRLPTPYIYSFQPYANYWTLDYSNNFTAYFGG